MQRRGLCLLVLALGCGATTAGDDDDAKTMTPPPPTCGDGTEELYGVCVPVGSALACPRGQRPSLGSGECVSLGKVPCADGFETAADGVGCRPIVPAEPCGEGQRATLGQTTCVDVGWNDCAPLFDPSRSGYGCVDRTPIARCEDATRIDLMTGTCVALDTCATPTGDVVLTPADDVQAALDAAAAGQTIALTAGRYAGDLRIDRALTIRGACSADTVLEGRLAISGDHDVALNGITLGGTLSIFDDATVTANAIRIEEATDTGILVQEGGSLSLTNAVVRNVAGAGTSILVGLRGSLELDEVEIAGGARGGVIMLRGTEVTGRRVTIHHVRPRGGDDGDAIGLREGGRLVLSESAIFEFGGFGITAFGSSSTVELDRVVIRRGFAGQARMGIGINVGDNAQVTGTRVQLERNTEAGIVGDTGSAVVDLEKAVIVDTRPPIGGIASGVVMVRGPTIRLRDSVVLDNTYTAVAVLQATSEITGSKIGGASEVDGVAVFAGVGGTATVVDSTLTGSDVYEAQPRDPESVVRLERSIVWHSTVAAVDGGRLEIVESAFVDAIDYAIGAETNGAHVLVQRSTVGGTRIGENETVGEALIVFENATGKVEDCDFYDNQKNGAFVYENGALEIDRTIITETKVDGATGKQANGIEVQGTLTLRDSVVADNERMGIFLGETADVVAIERSHIDGNGIIGVFGHSGTLQIVDTTIENTKTAPADTEVAGEMGYGIISGTRATITGAIVRNNATAGVFLEGSNDESTRIDLVSSVVRDTRADGNAAFGHGLFSAHADQVFVRESWFIDNDAAGIAFHDSTGLLSSTASLGNKIGIHAQVNSDLREVEAEPELLSPAELLVTSDCKFVENQTKIGSGEIPVPLFPVLPE